MTSQITLKKSKGKAGGGFYVDLGRTYKLEDGRIGVVKFIGKVVAKPGVEWIGLEITKGKGKNNGSVQGVDYFKVDKKGQGAFVQLGKIKSQVAGKAGKTVKSDVKKDGAIATGKNDKYDAAEFKLESQGSFLDEKNLKATTGGKVARKEGAIETGRSDYDVAKFEQKDDGGSFLAEKNAAATEVKKGDVAHKDGAIDTGRNEEYETYTEKPKDEAAAPAEPEPLPGVEEPKPEPINEEIKNDPAPEEPKPEPLPVKDDEPLPVATLEE